MRFDCGPTRDELRRERLAKLREWHPWFAWRPIKIGGGRCVWLETIERRFPAAFISELSGQLHGYRCQYRLPEQREGKSDV